jgi:Sugar (and other) transporter
MMAELLPKPQAEFGSGFAYLMITSGTLLSYATQNIFDRAFLVANWRFVLLLPAAVSVLRLLLFPALIKSETPKFIFASEKDKARAERRIVRAFEQVYVAQDAAVAAREAIGHLEADRQGGQASIRSLFSQQYRKRFVSGLLVAFTMQASGINFFLFYSTKLFDNIEAGYGKTMTLVIGVNNFLGSILAILLIGRLGRKFNLVVGLLLQAVGMYLLLIGYQAHSLWMLAVACCLYMLAFAVGFGGTETAYLGEILPPAGVGFALAFQWAITGIVGLFLAELIDTVGPTALIAFFAVACTLLVFVLDFTTVETKGKSEQTVAREFASGNYKFMDLCAKPPTRAALLGAEAPAEA